MTRVTSKPFIAGAFALLLGGTMLSTPAWAAKLIWTELEDDNSVTCLYQNEDGHIWAMFISADGKTYESFDPGESNPYGDTTGPGSHSDKPDVVSLIKVGEVTYKVKIAPADSPELAAHLRGALEGGGLGPHYNPGDDDNGHGPGNAPDHSLGVKKTPDEIAQEIATANAIARQLANIGGAMGDGDEGGSEGPNGPNKHGKGGDSGDDEGNYTEGQSKDVGATEKALLGAKPEYVNPPHWERTGVGGSDHSAGGAGGAGGGGGGGHVGSHG